MVEIDRKYYDYTKMTSIKPLTEFKDIQVGEIYHIPPTILYGRRDFICESKDFTTVTGKLTYEDGRQEKHTFYSTELSIKYFVKKQEINKV